VAAIPYLSNVGKRLRVTRSDYIRIEETHETLSAQVDVGI
jgi:hypothetical protein